MGDDELDDFLDSAIGQLGSILGDMGYAMPEPGPFTLECPSGLLLACDLAALPRAAAEPGRIVVDGKARGAVLRVGESVLAGVRDALPGAVNDLLLIEREVPAARERTRVALAPVTGAFLLGDATLLAGVKRAPRRAPQAPADVTFGAVETVTRVARERGARLGPTAMALLLHTAPTGLWHGVVHGRDALVVMLSYRHTLRIREGVDAQGRRSYLRFDTLRDAVMADPRLRRMDGADRTPPQR